MHINVQKFISVIFFLSLLILSENSLAQKDKDQINNMVDINSNGVRILSSTVVTYIEEDFSTAAVVTPPYGWTQNMIIGVEGVDLWHFDNPGNRVLNLPISEPVAIFDSDEYSNNGQPEEVALESPDFSPPDSTQVLVEWSQHFLNYGEAEGNLEIWNGNSWVLMYSVNTPTLNNDFQSIDISAYVAGVTDAKIRFRYTGNFSGFWIIDNVVVYGSDAVPAPAQPIFPQNGAVDIDINSILEWTAGNGSAPTGYRLYFGTDGDGIIPPTNIEDNTDLSLTNYYTPSAPLLYGINYYWMVVPYNTEGDATGNEIWSFTVITDPPITVFPYLEDFEGSFPPFYYIRYSGMLSDPIILTSTNSGWDQDNWRNIISPVNKAARLNISGTSQNYWLAGALIDLGTQNNYQLEFDLSLNAAGTSNPPETSGADDRFAVVISTDGGITWETSNILKLWDNDGSPDIYNDISDQGEHITIDLSSYTGLIQLGFYGESTIANADNDLMIDNIEIKEIVLPVPEFSIVPSSLDFGFVAVGDSAVLQATIYNPGMADLIINSITSSDGQFTFSPNSFPVTISPDTELTCNIIFIPDSIGMHSAVLEIIHNADGSPVFYSVQGYGTDDGPTFNVSPSELNYGIVGVNTINDLTLTVSNLGLVNALEITDVSIVGEGYIVDPITENIPTGESRVFIVTFNPLSVGTYQGNLIFTCNDTDSLHIIPLSGDAVTGSGLLFEEDTVYQMEDNSYVQTLQLKGMDPLGGRIQAIQFRMALNKQENDNTILAFQNIEKGTDVSGTDWVLDYNLFRGPITGNGASVDSIYILLYNLNQDAGLDPSLDYNDLLNVKYRIARLPALTDTLKSTIRIMGAEATTANGYPINITSSENILIIMAVNRISSLGDVNGDGYLDILDLILVVDHIVGRDSLSGDYFTRADISPWLQGTPKPEPDGFVNVQDLSLIQNIILTGIYPDNTLNESGDNSTLPKVAGDIDAKVTFYINNEGISIYIDSKMDIRGAQFELNNINDEAVNISICTDLGEGYYFKNDALLRTVLYDRLADKIIKAGEHFMADIPLKIENPEDIVIEKLILVNIKKTKIENILIEMIYGNAPSLPLEYILFQNYPNPFNPATTIKFQVPQTCFVNIRIYNMLGQEVKRLFSEQVSRGNHWVNWDGLNEARERMSSGIYIYRITTKDFMQSKKMLLLK